MNGKMIDAKMHAAIMPALIVLVCMILSPYLTNRDLILIDMTMAFFI